MVNDIAVQDFVNAIKEKPTDTNTTYNATVSHVDSEGIVWVNLYGSTIATPTTSTSSEVKSGDQVTVNWRNNKLYIGGNFSNPSAGVTTVNRVEGVANNAKMTADIAYDAANRAVADAERAKVAADEAEASASQAATSAGQAATAAQNAQNSASSAGENASRAQAAAEAAQLAVLETITQDTIHYLATSYSSGVTKADSPSTYGTWSTTVQTIDSTKKYLWTYHTYTSADSQSTDTTPVITGVYGDTGQQGQQGATGDTGTSITAVQPQYYLSTSDQSATGGSWSNTMTYVVGKYIWTRDQISYSDNTTGYSTAVYNEALTQSCADAAEAMGLVMEQQEYFWHDALGAHVLSDKSTVSGTRHRTDFKGAGMEIFALDGQNDVKVAKFGASGAQIGASDTSHLEMDYHSMQMVDKDGETYFAVQDLRDTDGYAELTYVYTFNTNATYSDLPIDLPYAIVSVVSVKLNGANQTYYINENYNPRTVIDVTNITVHVGDALSIVYKASVDAKAYTLGTRAQGDFGQPVGVNSVAEGTDVLAMGTNSHAQNLGTIAYGDNSTAIGKYNKYDLNKEYAFIVGNGTADNARSNAFAVGWNGNVSTSGNITASGNISASSNISASGDITASGEITDGNGKTVSKAWTYVNAVTATTITAKETNTKVPITAVSYGTGFAYDSTNKGVKCTKAGTYIYSLAVPFDTATSADLIGVSVNKGSSTLSTQYTRVGGNYDVAVLSPTVVTLAVNDVLTIYVRNNSGARGVTAASCRFTIWEI